MNTQRDMPAEVYPTRREIREMERRAEAAARLSAHTAAPGASPALTPPSAAPQSEEPEAFEPGSDFSGPIPMPVFTPVTGFDAIDDATQPAPPTPAAPFTPVAQWAIDTGEIAKVDAAVETATAAPGRRSASPSVADSLVETAGHRITFARGIATPTRGIPTPAGDASITNMAGGVGPAQPLTPRTVARTWMPRVALLGTLAAATSVIPITGAPAAPTVDAVGISYSASDPLDVLMGATPESATADVSALGADPSAAVRAVVSASRSLDRQSCTANTAAANGVDAAEVSSAPVDLVMPLASGSYRLTSRYGYRSLWGRYSQHAGVDMAAPVGTPIHSIADGVVEYAGAGKHGRSSMLIIVRHNVNGKIVRSWYVHMYSSGVYASAGQQVKAGDVIGAVGNNGNSTGPHLHLEIHLDDNLTTTDPLTWLQNNGAQTLTRDVLDCIAN